MAVIFVKCIAKARNANYPNGLVRDLNLVPVPEWVKTKIAELGEEIMSSRWAGSEYYWLDQEQLDMLDALFPVASGQMILGDHGIYAKDEWGREYQDGATSRRIAGGCLIQMCCMR